VPLHFPVEETVPESRRHFKARCVLCDSVERELRGRALVASDQFLYWDPTSPKQCLAPDLAVRRGERGEPLKSWKTWERGAPHVGVEIVSDSDASELVLDDKLQRYRRAGVAEVVAFDAQDLQHPIRLWDLVDGDLVERELSTPESLACDALGLWWCVRSDPEYGPMLRLARDPQGADLVLTPEEAERAAKEAALARVAELEASLAARR
jgi:hypothetical protein